MTPNDACFVRYHLSHSPSAATLLAPDAFKLSVVGKVGATLEFLEKSSRPARTLALNNRDGTDMILTHRI